MEFHGREENYMLGMNLEEMKIVYRSIWNDLKASGQLGKDEVASDLLFELQSVLQKEAQREGIDVAIHSEWANWVGLDQTKCDF